MISHEEIIKKFPMLFRGHCNYIECEDGWNNIVLTLCILLNNRYEADVRRLEFLSSPRDTLEKTKEFLKQHKNEIEKLAKNLTEEGRYPVAAQIKEKFGGLRAYVDCCDEVEYGFCTFAEIMSEQTCAGCGNPGAIRGRGGWLRCVCEDCEKQDEEK